MNAGRIIKLGMELKSYQDSVRLCYQLKGSGLDSEEIEQEIVDLDLRIAKTEKAIKKEVE